MADLGKWSLTVGGEAAERQITLNLDDLQKSFQQQEVTAVCQCSGNRRGLSSPHVAGVEWGYGAMGNAVWRGPRLKDVLAKAGVKAAAMEVWLDGADNQVLATTPDYPEEPSDGQGVGGRGDHRDLDEWRASAAFERISRPCRRARLDRDLLDEARHSIQLSTKPLDSFWMQKAYRVPAGMFAVEHPFPTPGQCRQPGRSPRSW